MQRGRWRFASGLGVGGRFSGESAGGVAQRISQVMTGIIPDMHLTSHADPDGWHGREHERVGLRASAGRRPSTSVLERIGERADSRLMRCLLLLTLVLAAASAEYAPADGTVTLTVDERLWTVTPHQAPPGRDGFVALHPFAPVAFGRVCYQLSYLPEAAPVPEGAVDPEDTTCTIWVNEPEPGPEFPSLKAAIADQRTRFTAPGAKPPIAPLGTSAFTYSHVGRGNAPGGAQRQVQTTSVIQPRFGGRPALQFVVQIFERPRTPEQTAALMAAIAAVRDGLRRQGKPVFPAR